MATGQELEIIKKMDAADYVGFLRDSEGVESDWLLHYYPKNGSRGRIFLTQRRREAENAEKIANL